MRQWTIDAFASEPFKGNPACVVEPFDVWPADDWMQALAAENNQAETAFLLRTNDAARFGLRWFTPMLEVPLCGHATLASGHAVLAEMGAPSDEVRFDTLSGPLRVARAARGYEMDFPASPPKRVPPPEGLAEALGVQPIEVWAAQFLVAILDSERAVRDLAPDIGALKPISSAATQGRGNVGVTAAAAKGSAYDAVSRFFAPGSGISRKTRRPAPCTASSPRCGRRSWDKRACVSIRPTPAEARMWSASKEASGCFCEATP